MSISSTLRPALRSAAPYVPAPLTRVLRYPKETLFVNRLANFAGADPSIVFYTTNKCASMLMSRILACVNQRVLGLTHLNLAAYFWDAASTDQVPVYDYLARNPQFYFRDRGILYAPLRAHLDLSHLQHARVLAMLRDPRDVIVSYYFSTRFSHRAPSNRHRRKVFLERRAMVSELSLEEYVLRFSGELESRYAAYRQNISRDSVLTYEQMWWDFSGFADQLARVLGVDFDASLKQELADMASFKGKGTENVKSHQRKGTPGDHKEKLSVDTANQISAIFNDSLRWLYN